MPRLKASQGNEHLDGESYRESLHARKSINSSQARITENIVKYRYYVLHLKRMFGA